MQATTTLTSPHGGTLTDLIVDADRQAELEDEAQDLPSLSLTDRQLCDLELLLNGGFSPLTGFLTEEEYEGVVEDMRLPDGTLWPMPITLDVDSETAESYSAGDRIALRDATGLLLAVLTVDDIYKPDKEREAEAVFGKADEAHPAVFYLFDQAGSHYIGGSLEGVQLPPHYDFEDLRRTPRQLREYLQENGNDEVIGFQTRNPMHRAHKELTDRALEETNGHLVIHPVVGLTKPGDIDPYTRVRCYKKLLQEYPDGKVTLSALPLAMRMGGPREALWHAIIRKNYGCSHFIVGRDHAGPGDDSNGEPFYGTYEAQELTTSVADELGMTILTYNWMVYVPEVDAYQSIDAVDEDTETLMISGTELRRRLQAGENVPEWFSYPQVVDELRHSYPPRKEQGFTVFFTGLSGSGKSTLANALHVKLLEEGERSATLLDGDIVRTHLSKELGFSQEDRSTNVRRIGFVASEITKHGGAAVCAPIAPYAADRAFNEQLIESQGGGYIEVFVDAPLEVCEERDVKGLYAKARAGIIKDFTGIDDPYEAPRDADVVCKTADESVAESLQKVLNKLAEEGFIDRIEA